MWRAPSAERRLEGSGLKAEKAEPFIPHGVPPSQKSRGWLGGHSVVRRGLLVRARELPHAREKMEGKAHARWPPCARSRTVRLKVRLLVLGHTRAALR
eukprot:2410195-Pleurochrysis_carterae.AAC.2